ncbi:hypothetical protein LZZ90_12740 [Flavobacterium sp. SM15]|uniref:hypothetical protein n=1 Tax=Flavobacterium sp. SM15 TaxID=2908005 RepID=UPI001EDA800C|nr:hypothetical protein [Flavobacterium sp. SM15]MCG2612375.1 hypothetical protein [Flavobacterium sp. SM15]
MENSIVDLTEFQKIALRNLKMVGIEVEFIEDNKIRIRQVSNYNNYILTKKELLTRAKDIFPDFIVHPVRYSLTLKDIDNVWVATKIKEIGLHTNDILSQTAIDRTSLSLYLSGEKKMTATVKALFYYYFLSFELNRDLRGELNRNDF